MASYDSVEPTTNQERENRLVNRALTSMPEPFISGLKLNADIALYRTSDQSELTLNTIDENNAIWVVTDIDGWWNVPQMELPDLPRGWGDGSYDAIGRWSNRILTLSGSFLVQDPDDAPAARDKLIEYLSPLVKTDGAGYLIVTEFGEPIQIYNAEEQANPRLVVFTVPEVTDIAVGDYVKVSKILYNSDTQPDVSNNFNSATSGFLVTAVNSGGIGEDRTIEVDRGEILGDYTGTTFPGGGIIRKVIKRLATKVRLSGPPSIISVNARGRHDFVVGLKAVDPIKYEFVEGDPDGYDSVTISTSSGSGSATITNSGNVAVPIIVELSAGFSIPSTSNPPTITNADSDQSMTIIGATESNHRLEIDTYNREVLDVTYSGSTVVNVANGRSKASVLIDWIYLNPGTNDIELTNFPTGGTATIYYRSGWIG